MFSGTRSMALPSLTGEVIIPIGKKVWHGVQTIPLSGKRFHIIGRMKSKPCIIAKMELSGAKHRVVFSHNIDILVIPDDADAQQPITRTLTMAREQEKQGALTIISESQMEEILSGNP